MSMHAINYIIVGTKMLREEFVSKVGQQTWEFREDTDHDLTVIDGAEKQWDEVVVGIKVKQFDCQYPEASEPTNLNHVKEENLKKAVQELWNVGLESSHVSIYLVGAFM